MKRHASSVIVAVTACPPAPVTEIFEGTLPSDDRLGVGTRLVLQPDGTYSMIQTYEAATDGNMTLTARGRWQAEGTALRLVPQTSGDIRRFVRLPSGDLRMVDRRQTAMAMTVLRRRGT